MFNLAFQCLSPNAVHIIFDDAFEHSDATGKYVPNAFVRQFISSMEDATRYMSVSMDSGVFTYSILLASFFTIQHKAGKP